MENVDRYKEALLNPEIPFEQLRELDPLPEYLYKYVRFDENSYWKNYVEGKYHLSCPRAFEDQLDCKPSIQNELVLKGLRYIDRNYGIEKAKEYAEIYEQCSGMKLFEDSTSDTYHQIMAKFRSTFRIGCFTSLFDNSVMWERYAEDGNGIIIKYRTRQNSLFDSFMHQIIYIDNVIPYNVSNAVAILLALDGIPETQYVSLREKADRITWTCSYIKNTKWRAEKEYRLTIPPYIVDSNNRIKNTEYTIIEENNISLKKSIDKIYVGKTSKSSPDFKPKMVFLENTSDKTAIPIEYI